MRHPSGRWARCRRNARILRAPRSSDGEAAPTEPRRRTSMATRRPRGSRASRSTSSRPSRRLRERITQPLRARERAASASASRPTIARCALLIVTTACSGQPRTYRVLPRFSLEAAVRDVLQPGHRCGDDAASRRVHQALQGVRGLDSPHWIPSRIRGSAVRARP